MLQSSALIFGGEIRWPAQAGTFAARLLAWRRQNRGIMLRDERRRAAKQWNWESSFTNNCAHRRNIRATRSIRSLHPPADLVQMLSSCKALLWFRPTTPESLHCQGYDCKQADVCRCRAASLIAQSNCGLNPHSASRGNIAGEQRNRAQQHRHRSEGHRISCFHAIKHRAQQPRQPECRQ